MKPSEFRKLVREEVKKVLRVASLKEDAASEDKIAKLQAERAKIDQQIAGLNLKKAALQKQIDMIQKK